MIGQHVQLRKAGRSWKGLCPFHGEKTPSFNVMPDKGFFHCFGCQKHGDVFTFVMEIEGKSFVEAAEQLGMRFGVSVPKIEESPEARRARGERVAMLDINKLATAFFRETLADPKRGEPGRAYLAKRGVGDATADAFQLGYAPARLARARRPPQGQGARPRARGQARARRQAAACRRLLRSVPRSARVPGDRARRRRRRVLGARDRLAGAGVARRVRGGRPAAEVHQQPGEHRLQEVRLLFGLAQAREGMQKLSRAVLVEGNFDVITLHQAEFTEVVAPLGTALTLEQVQMLKRLTPCIVLLYDGDRAGYKATMSALQLCVDADVEVKVASRPGNANSGGAGLLADGVDPDSLVASGGAAQLREAIDRARSGIEFFCYEVWGKHKANADARTRAIEDAARLAAKIENPIKRELVVDTLAKGLDVEPGLVRTAVQRAASGNFARPVEARSGHPNAPASAPSSVKTEAAAPPIEEVEVISLLSDHPSLIASVDADKAFWLLTDETLRAMYHRAREGTPFAELRPRLFPRRSRSTCCPESIQTTRIRAASWSR